MSAATAPDACYVLKYYLRSLPNPPLAQDLLRPMAQVCLIDDLDEGTRIKLARCIIQVQPRVHIDVLHYVLSFIVTVPRSKKSFAPVAEIFGFLLLCPRHIEAYLEKERDFPMDAVFSAMPQRHHANQRGSDFWVRETVNETERAAGGGGWRNREQERYIENVCENLMLWLMQHWKEIEQGLFESPGDPKSEYDRSACRELLDLRFGNLEERVDENLSHEVN